MSTVRRYPLLAYTLLAVAQSRWITPLSVPGFPAFRFGPDLATWAVVGLTAGLPGVRTLLAQLRSWRIVSRWDVLAVAGPATIGWLVTALTRLRHPQVAHLPGPGSLREFVIILPVMVVVGGALGEELGWRGYLQPRLLQRHHPWPPSDCSPPRISSGICRCCSATTPSIPQRSPSNCSAAPSSWPGCSTGPAGCGW